MHNLDINKEILFLLNEIKLLPKEDLENITMYLENNEIGVAFDTLCNQIYENDIKITFSFYSRIENVGRAMKMQDSTWIFLIKLIEE